MRWNLHVFRFRLSLGTIWNLIARVLVFRLDQLTPSHNHFKPKKNTQTWFPSALPFSSALKWIVSKVWKKKINSKYIQWSLLLLINIHTKRNFRSYQWWVLLQALQTQWVSTICRDFDFENIFHLNVNHEKSKYDCQFSIWQKHGYTRKFSVF